MSPFMLLVIVVLLILAFVILTYNKMITLRNRADEAWSDIDVQLKRRYNLIPNLVETVKGYAAHEEGVLTKVTEARSNAINATSMKEQAQAENVLSGALKSLFAVAENYPDLKANENFMQLQNELVDTEDKIQAARRFYNTNVRDFNTKLQTFPHNIVAGMFKFEAKEFFEVEDEEQKEPVKVDFSKEEKTAAPAEQPAATPEVQPAAAPTPQEAPAAPAPEAPAETPPPAPEAPAPETPPATPEQPVAPPTETPKPEEENKDEEKTA